MEVWIVFHDLMQSLILQIREASDTGQKGHFFEIKGNKHFNNPYSIPFFSVLQQNKALHNFY